MIRIATFLGAGVALAISGCAAPLPPKSDEIQKADFGPYPEVVPHSWTVWQLS